MTEKNAAVLALEEFGRQRAEFWRNPPRGQCEWPEEPGCREDDAILHVQVSGEHEGLEFCAGHSRQVADRNKPYPCDECGQGPAFRDPLGRKNEMKCARCHEKDGYVPGERAMVNKTTARVGVTHPLARKIKCIAAGITECGGEVKQRGKLGLICNKHHDPVKWNNRRQA
jgi:hypothetical protein